MRWLLLGAVLAVLLLFPPLLAAVATAAGWLLAKPVLVAFAAGLLAGVRAPSPRRWAR
ncbi:hypothetical protein ABT052_17870 [Streptomyces sp. NPDC002766]|uniref:hypothetical protein n=1 Tax=Streptomyces sp. NPDC002766 TaxID=3154429 RepID=UPI0033201C9B